MAIRIAIPKEVTPGEKRVALVPEILTRMKRGGVDFRVERGAGVEAYFSDEAYRTAGAEVTDDRKELVQSADIVLHVQPPTIEEIGWMRSGIIAVGFMNPPRGLDEIRKMQQVGVTAFALELLPRVTRAQSMDALSSQATVSGYRAALLGAEFSPKFLPMLTTAAGTIRPATGLVLGAGVAGLMAIATARRLGALVVGYDVRRAAGEQVRSLGAKFLELAINAEGTGGYARELTPEEKAEEQKMVAEAVAQADIVITTANVPGRRAPRLIGADMVRRMRPGAVIVDLAAESGGNCELTKGGETVRAHGVTILGPLDLPSQLPLHASQMYAKNLEAFLSLLIDSSGKLTQDFSDEILVASLLVAGGEVRYGPTRELLARGSP